MLSGEEFGRLFETFERTAFRLETLDVYDVEEEREEIARFLAGEDMGPEWSDSPWVRSMTDKGKSVSRPSDSERQKAPKPGAFLARSCCIKRTPVPPWLPLLPGLPPGHSPAVLSAPLRSPPNG
ncbi:DUF6879 family protein [Streptomyces sp. NPDC057424]|uniref:DUF6879 family protein n=1 Tax=Streptomyces sp. NPDC057424 TaxID=3346127 RepID=UPI00369A9808